MAKIRQIFKCQTCKYWRKIATPDENRHYLDLSPSYVQDMSRGLCVNDTPCIVDSDSAFSCSHFSLKPELE